MVTRPRLLFVHAHPDDETLTTGATIAHYADQGAEVRVVTCTLGEEGEVIGDRWARLVVDGADQLGGYRIGELTSALAHLGVAEPIFLGGAGRWRDSGMAGTPPRHRQRFVDADPGEAVGALVAIIREFRPHVVVTYDPDGGYGHPDHIHAHQVTTAAVAASASAGHPGEPWQVPKFYWAVMALSSFETGAREMVEAGLPADWIWNAPDEIRFAYADGDIDAVVEAPQSRAAKVAAMRAHATQVIVDPGGRACALSNLIALPITTSEHFVLAAGEPGERDGRGWEVDLLAGVNLG
jgi:N-acetyl-1-D-myo-inositol-2-amino-2-deoxy-alpha-D-glucopyranoside deacetylase